MKYIISMPDGWNPKDCTHCPLSEVTEDEESDLCVSSPDVCPLSSAVPVREGGLRGLIECEIDCIKSGNTITPHEQDIAIEALTNVLYRYGDKAKGEK